MTTNDSLLAQAVKPLLPLAIAGFGDTHENAAAEDGRRGHDLVTKFVFCDQLEPLWIRLEDEGLTILIDGVDIGPDQNERGRERPAQASLPHLFAGIAGPANGHAGGVHH